MYYGAQVSEFEVKSFSLRFLAALVAHLAGLCGYDSVSKKELSFSLVSH